MGVDLNFFIPECLSSRKKLTLTKPTRNFREGIFTYVCKLKPRVISYKVLDDKLLQALKLINASI